MTTKGRVLNYLILDKEAIGQLKVFIKKLKDLDDRIRRELKDCLTNINGSISRNDYMDSVDVIIKAGIESGTVKDSAAAKQIKVAVGCESLALALAVGTMPEVKFPPNFLAAIKHESPRQEAVAVCLLEKSGALNKKIEKNTA